MLIRYRWPRISGEIDILPSGGRGTGNVCRPPAVLQAAILQRRSDEAAMRNVKLLAAAVSATLSVAGCAYQPPFTPPALGTYGGSGAGIESSPYYGYGYGSSYPYQPGYNDYGAIDPRYAQGMAGPYPYGYGYQPYPRYVVVPCPDNNRDGRCDRRHDGADDAGDHNTPGNHDGNHGGSHDGDHDTDHDRPQHDNPRPRDRDGNGGPHLNRSDAVPVPLLPGKSPQSERANPRPRSVPAPTRNDAVEDGRRGRRVPPPPRGDDVPGSSTP